MGILKTELRQVLKTEFQQLDTNAFLWLQQNCCNARFTPFIRFISFTGDGWLYLIITVGVLLNNLEKNLTFFIVSLIAYAIQIPLYITLKSQFKRNRPQDFLTAFKAQIKPADQFSFPSGHTASALVMAIQVSLFFPSFSLFAIGWGLSIGISRILLGVHFPGDILAGISLGILSALLANEIFSLIPMI